MIKECYIDLRNHKLLEKTPEIEQLCLPLKDKLKVTYFNYVKINADNSRVILTDRAKYIEDYYRTHAVMPEYSERIEKKHILKNSSYPEYFLWKKFESATSPFFVEARERYNIANGITLIKYFTNYVELYYFGTAKNNTTAPEIYESNIDQFERFILYFKNNGRKLLKFADDNAIKIENTAIDIPSYDAVFNKRYPLFSDLGEFRFTYRKGKENLFLSEQETKCIAYIIRQFSMREIADMLKRSPKTIEAHINNIKRKLNCSSRQSLVKDLLKLDKENSAFYNDKINKSKLASEYATSLYLKNIYLDHIKKDLYITKQEAICLYYFCHGYDAKTLGKKIHNSYKTIERHIYDIKLKFGIKKRSALVHFCLYHNLLNMITIAYPNLIDSSI